MVKHKFHAKPTTHNGFRYDSKKEATYAQKLDLAKKANELLFYLRQAPFHLPGNITYRIDFIEFWAPKNGDQGEVIFTEVKGFMTTLARTKISMVEDLYNIKINII